MASEADHWQSDCTRRIQESLSRELFLCVQHLVLSSTFIVCTLQPALCPGGWPVGNTPPGPPCPLPSDWAQPTGLMGRKREKGETEVWMFIPVILATKGTAILKAVDSQGIHMTLSFGFWQKFPLAYLCLGILVNSTGWFLWILWYLNKRRVPWLNSSNYSNWACYLFNW